MKKSSAFRRVLLVSCGAAALGAFAPGRLAAEVRWPEGQALPRFERPAETVDAIERQALRPDERLLFSSLQGLVNRKRPRLLLLDARAEEGRDTWAETVGLGPRTLYSRDQRLDLLRKYADEAEGVVLYDPTRSDHYRNLAGTVAALENALPLSTELYEELAAEGLSWPVRADLRPLEMTGPVAIYEHLYETYWPRCEKRILLSARPTRRGDLDHARDVTTAVRAATVWLDARIPEERALFKKFLADMPAGRGLLLGWHASERSGVTTASEFGIGTVPSDFYVSGSVFAGTSRKIAVPPVPRLPTLENKAYVALFISDGDNVQYNQHAMRRLWDRTAAGRGEVPLNWTISPALVDLGPGLLNYYYRTATPADCFVTGPSGLGYLMPVNTLREPGAPLGRALERDEPLREYARQTDRYLRAAGLRVATIWDDLTADQRAIYADECRHLFGATVQNFRDDPGVASSIVDERVRFERLVVPYCTTEEHFRSSLRRRLRRWNGERPTFLAFQMNVWQSLRPDRLEAIAEELEAESDGRIEFVRADHYFNLQQQSDGLPFALTLSADATATVPGEPPRTTTVLNDGSDATAQTLSGDGPWTVEFAFAQPREVVRCRIGFGTDEPIDVTLTAGPDDEPLEAASDRVTAGLAEVGGAVRRRTIELAAARPAETFRVALTPRTAGTTVTVTEIELFGR
ncbi:protein containing Coagulation factor 5/8 type [Alienimonas sp. DA493]|uniref:protein containing Coagulation factor 5/8 type n=1 Tax=Alienimonas sp. DA493 TaxID=3373605 RepID=UPI003754707F